MIAYRCMPLNALIDKDDAARYYYHDMAMRRNHSGMAYSKKVKGEDGSHIHFYRCSRTGRKRLYGRWADLHWRPMLITDIKPLKAQTMADWEETGEVYMGWKMPCALSQRCAEWVSDMLLHNGSLFWSDQFLVFRIFYRLRPGKATYLRYKVMLFSTHADVDRDTQQAAAFSGQLCQCGETRVFAMKAVFSHQAYCLLWCSYSGIGGYHQLYPKWYTWSGCLAQDIRQENDYITSYMTLVVQFF